MKAKYLFHATGLRVKVYYDIGVVGYPTKKMRALGGRREGSMEEGKVRGSVFMIDPNNFLSCVFSGNQSAYLDQIMRRWSSNLMQ